MNPKVACWKKQSGSHYDIHDNHNGEWSIFGITAASPIHGVFLVAKKRHGLTSDVSCFPCSVIVPLLGYEMEQRLGCNATCQSKNGSGAPPPMNDRDRNT